jgi:hypothetical protein
MRARPETGPDGTGTVEVDFAGVSQLVGTVRELAARLAGYGDLWGHMNDPDLMDAVYRVNRNWHKQCVTLQTFLDSTADQVSASLATYRYLETELGQALQGSQ